MSLEKLRSEIDVVDMAILDQLAERQKLVIQVAHYKQQHGLEVVQKQRFTSLMAERIKIGKAKGLSAKMIRAIWEAIHDGSVAAQRKES